MNDATAVETKQIYDKGIEEGAARLTPQKIHQTYQQMMDAEAGARLKTYVETCVSCGLCSEACHFYLSNDKDPRFAPAGKVRQTMAELMKKKGKVSVDFMKKASEIASTECNLCKRCAQYCPFGLDVAFVMLFVRRLCHKLGISPQYIQDTAHSHSATYNQMWVKEDEWIDSLQWQEEEAQEEIENLRIPVEKEGADIFYSVIGPEPKFRAQLIYQAAVIFNAAGLNWTMPATPGWDNSDMAMYTGDNEIMARIKRMHFETAMRLKVKRVVMGECGHAFRSIYDVGNRALGWRMPPVEVTHSIEFFYELLRDDKIKIQEKFKPTVTIHDPCNVIRGRGLHQMLRYVVHAICENVVEMHPNRELNFCCSAGGGVINCGPPWKMKRVNGNKVKANQLFEAKSRGAETCVAPCHNCHGGLEDIIHHNEIGMDLKFLGDIIYEVMEKPARV